MDISTKTAVLLAAGVLALGTAGGAAAGGMVTGAQIKNGTVTGQDVANRSLASVELTTGATRRFTRIQGFESRFDSVEVSAGEVGRASVSCSTGRRFLGGGAWWAGSDVGVQLVPDSDSSGAQAYAAPLGAADVLVVRITCAAVTGSAKSVDATPRTAPSTRPKG